MKNKPLYPIVPRLDDGQITLYMNPHYKQGRMGLYVDAFDPFYGHNEVDYGYYLGSTKPVDMFDDEVQRLFKNYIKNWEGCSIPVLRKKFRLQNTEREHNNV